MAVHKQMPLSDAAIHAGSRSAIMPSLVRKVNEETHIDAAAVKACGPTEEDIDIDLREVYFLIMHFLSGGPCHRTCGQLWNELLEHKLLPRRYHAWYSRSAKQSGDEDDDGLSFPLSYAQLVERYPHIKKNHLVKLLQQLLLKSNSTSPGASDAKIVTGADVPTLLGSGSFSLLESEKARDIRPAHRGEPYLRWPHLQANQVHGLSLREIGGGFGKHHRAPSVRAACYAIARPSALLEKIQITKKLRGHQNAVYCAIFDRSGQYVITGSDDRLVKIWSMETGFCLSSCRGHEGDITDLAVSSNNALVASASNDCIIRVWRLPDGLPISVLRGHMGAVTAIAFSPRMGCEYHLLSSSDDGTCRIWDARDVNINPRLYVARPVESTAAARTNGLKANDPSQYASQRGSQILCCAFNANGTIFVTGSSDTIARVWSACKWSDEVGNQVNHELDVLAGHENDVNYVQFSGSAVTARSFSADSTKEEKLPKFKNSWFLHDNIVTCSRDGSAIIWIPKSRRAHCRVGRWIRAYHLKVPPPPMPPQQPRGGPRQRMLPTPRGVNMIVWSLDNRFVLAAIMDCRICVWNAVDGSLVHSLTGHTESTYVLDVHPFNPRIAMSAGYDGKTIIWDIWEGVPIRIYETGSFKLVDGKFSPDGTSIVLSDEVGQIYILATGQGESQKDAKYDQFFLGDYRPLVQDAHGNVLDQETQLPPYRRNMQDLLCDISMLPYPEPYQSMYQQRRLGALGIDWQPPSVRLAVGTNDDGLYAIPDDILGQLPPAQIEHNRDRWLEQPAELEDAMDWEQENDVQSDDTGSEYNVTEECSSEGEQGSLNACSSEEAECSTDEDDNSSKDEGNSRAHLRRSKRKKHKAEGSVFTSSGRRVKKKDLERGDGTRSRLKKYKYSRNGRFLPKERLSEKTTRPQRRAARNALNLFSRIGGGSTDEDEYNEGDSGLQGSGYSQPDENPLSSESERCVRNSKQKSFADKDRLQDDLIPVASSFQYVDDNNDGEAYNNEETNKHARSGRRILLKLPSRDSRKLVLPESTKSDSDVQANANSSSAEICLKEEKKERACSSLDDLDVKHSDRQYLELSNAEYRPESAWCDDNDNGINKSFDENGTSLEHPRDLSTGYDGKEIRWGEVRTRTSKRPRLGDLNDVSRLDNGIAVDVRHHLNVIHSCTSQSPKAGMKGEDNANESSLQDVDEHGADMFHRKPRNFFLASCSEGLNVAECGDFPPDRKTNCLTGSFPGKQSMLDANASPIGHVSGMEANWKEDEGYMSEKFQTIIDHDLASNNFNEYHEMDEKVADNDGNVNLNHIDEYSYEATDTKYSDFSKLKNRSKRTKKGYHNISCEKKLNPSEDWEDFGHVQTLQGTRPVEEMSGRLTWRGSGIRSRVNWVQQPEENKETDNFDYNNDKSRGDIGLNAVPDAEMEGGMHNTWHERQHDFGANACVGESSAVMLQNSFNEDKQIPKITLKFHNVLTEGGRKARSKRMKQTKEFTQEDGTSNNHMIDESINYEEKRVRIQTERLDTRQSLVGSEWGSTSRVLSSLRPARNKKSTILTNLRMPVEKKKGRQSTRKQSWLMLSEAEEGNRYIPQFGDEVAYFIQGHQEFLHLSSLQEKGPWKSFKDSIQSVEFCRVVGLEYSPLAGSGDTCCKLILKFIGPESNVNGKSFKLTLPELTNFPDFLVEKSRYDAAIKRNWTHRDKCDVWWRAENGEGGNWYTGRIMAVKPKSVSFADSPWERYVVQYKDDTSGPHTHSPWELFDPGNRSLDLPQIDSEVNSQLLYSIAELEQTSNENEDCFGLMKLAQVSEKSDFHNRIPLPLSLDIIMRRLENYYYRFVGIMERADCVVIFVDNFAPIL
ncbi:hypothetical protein SUGI_0385500 [Cryptomeria japonica]|nr:hypothetical protein SUGI_0385500 [Cryptomeria japonica]